MFKKKNDDSFAKEQRFYAFVESVNAMAGIDGSPPPARTEYVLDAITPEALRATQGGPIESEDGLSIMRLQTTPNRLATLFGITRDIEGRWVEIVVGRARNRPRIWKLDANNSYGGNIERRNLVSLRAISILEERALRLDHSLTPLAKFDDTTGTESDTDAAYSGALTVRVLDVGHASCVAIHAPGRRGPSDVIGYYDAGAPTFFHMKGFPKSFTEAARVPVAGFVALSHWDFDHYSLAITKLRQLQSLKWYAPQQRVGKNCERFQNRLGSNLTFIDSPRYLVQRDVLLIRGQGAPSDRNNRGYAARIGSPRAAYLLTGDVGYSYLPVHAKKNLLGLAITHHGGKGASAPPFPLAPGMKAAVSYGKGNTYDHPDEDSLVQHTRNKWRVVRTAAKKRGDRWL